MEELYAAMCSTIKGCCQIAKVTHGQNGVQLSVIFVKSVTLHTGLE